MKALMSYTSSVFRMVRALCGALSLWVIICDCFVHSTTMMTGYFEWARLVAFLGMFMFQVGSFCF